jgi:hypothetical protein
VRFPEAWVKRTNDGRTVVFADENGFVVRRDVSQRDELLVAMRGLLPAQCDHPFYVYSDNFYAVALGGDIKVRPATLKEWEQAEELTNTRHQLKSDSPKQSTHANDAMYYRGKSFSKTGKFWGGRVGLISPDRKWLAVFSFSSRHKPRRSWSPLDLGGLMEPCCGKIFIDVYDTSSGERVLSGRRRYRFSPSMFFSAALWVGNEYLIVPCDPIKWRDVAGQACLLGILPATNK